MNKTLIVVMCITMALLAPIAGQAAIYYVATTGNDLLGDGSEGNPWASIDRADLLGALAPGDTVYVKSGIYSIDTSAAGGYGVQIGTASAGCTYVADPGGVTIQQTNVTGGVALVKVQNGMGATLPIVLDGFTILGGSPSGVNLWVYNAANVEVMNCVVDSAGFTPWYNFLTFSTSNILIHDNVIGGGGGTMDSRKYGSKWYNNLFAGAVAWGGWAMTFTGYQAGYQPGTFGNPGPPLTADRDEFMYNTIAHNGGWGGLNIDTSGGGTTYPCEVIHDYNTYAPWGGVPYAPGVVPGEHDVIPEPSAFAALGMGLIGLAGFRLRRKS